MTEAEQLFRTTLAQTNDPVSAIKLVRARFGLSLLEVKELWAHVRGYDSLSDAQATLMEPLGEALREHEQQRRVEADE